MFDYPPQELATLDKTLEPLLARAQEHAAEAEQLAMDATRLLSRQARSTGGLRQTILLPAFVAKIHGHCR